MFSSNVKRLCAVALACGALFVGGVAQAEVKKDLSSPKATLNTVASAMQEGDKETFKAAIAADDQQMKYVDSMGEMVNGMSQLRKAVKEKYGNDPDQLSMGVEDMAAEVEKATVKQEGDTAIVTMPEPERPDGMPEPTAEEAAASAKARELKLKKVGDEWKLEADSLLQGQEMDEQQLKQLQAASKIPSQTAEEIKAGKYPTYQEAMQAFMGRMMTTMSPAGMEQGEDGAPAPAPAPDAPDAEPAPAPAPAPGAAE